MTDLDHIHPEFAVFGSHIGKFRGPLDPPRALSGLISVPVGDGCDIRLTAEGPYGRGDSQPRRVRRGVSGEQPVALQRTVAYADDRHPIYRTEISGRDIV